MYRYLLPIGNKSTVLSWGLEIMMMTVDFLTPIGLVSKNKVPLQRHHQVSTETELWCVLACCLPSALSSQESTLSLHLSLSDWWCGAVFHCHHLKTHTVIRTRCYFWLWLKLFEPHIHTDTHTRWFSRNLLSLNPLSDVNPSEPLIKCSWTLDKKMVCIVFSQIRNKNMFTLKTVIHKNIQKPTPVHPL